MKIKVTIETHEIKALVREDLARHGIVVASDDDVVFDGGVAVVSVDAARDGTLTKAPAPPPAPVAPPPAPAPALAVVDGGANAVDMSDILNASTTIAQKTHGKYPPGERPLMDGESHDFPGTPRR